MHQAGASIICLYAKDYNKFDTEIWLAKNLVY